MDELREFYETKFMLKGWPPFDSLSNTQLQFLDGLDTYRDWRFNKRLEKLKEIKIGQAPVEAFYNWLRA